MCPGMLQQLLAEGIGSGSSTLRVFTPDVPAVLKLIGVDLEHEVHMYPTLSEDVLDTIFRHSCKVQPLQPGKGCAWWSPDDPSGLPGLHQPKSQAAIRWLGKIPGLPAGFTCPEI